MKNRPEEKGILYRVLIRHYTCMQINAVLHDINVHNSEITVRSNVLD